MRYNCNFGPALCPERLFKKNNPNTFEDYYLNFNLKSIFKMCSEIIVDIKGCRRVIRELPV